MESPGQAETRPADFDKLNFDTLKFGKLKCERTWLRRMRFEIGPRGGLVIVVGLLGLLAAVFFLETISELETARREQQKSRLSGIYSVHNGALSASVPHTASAAEPPVAPAVAVTPKSPPRAAIASENVPPAELPKQPQRPKAPAHTAVASAPPDHLSTSVTEQPGDSSLALLNSSAPSNKPDTDTHKGAAGALPPSARTQHRGYKILIAAATDRSAADRMASRLLGLGYASYVTPTEVNGQTWYRVQVGPYPTSAAARAAQANLQADYSAHYINRTD